MNIRWYFRSCRSWSEAINEANVWASRNHRRTFVARYGCLWVVGYVSNSEILPD